MTLIRPSVLASLLAGAVLASSLPAWAETAEPDAAVDTAPELLRARQYFNQGLKLYKDGDFDAALVQFERAYSTKPNYKVLFNIAQTYFELRQYVEARDTLARYMAEAGDQIEPGRREQVAQDLADLDRRIAHVKIDVNVTGAAVYVDGKKVGTTPLATAVDVNEGQRTISVEARDRGTKQRVIRVAGGEQQVVSVEFAPEATSAGATAPVGGGSTAAPGSSGLGAGFWITAVGAVALGAGAGITGYLALQAEDDHAQELGRFGARQSELDDTKDRANTFALTTDVLAGAAIACAGVAVVIWATTPSRPDAPRVGLSDRTAKRALDRKLLVAAREHDEAPVPAA